MSRRTDDPERTVGRITHDLQPRVDGPGDRIACRLAPIHPAAVFALVLFTCFAIAAALSAALGLLVTDILLDSRALADWDIGVVESIIAERTPFLTDVSEVGAVVGSYLLSVIALLVAIYFAYRREWTFAAFAACIPLVESGLYRLTSLAAPRQRPDVPRLEDLTPDASYPSGHVAASVAVYGGLAFVLSSRIEHAPTRYGVRAVVVLTIAFAALSRMYQGMHHPLDVAGGILVGLAAIVIVVFACRAAAAASTRRAMY